MDKTEFDKFADEYNHLHASNISASGESPEYFAKYKIMDLAHELSIQGKTESFRLLDFGTDVGSSIPYIQKYISEIAIDAIDVSRKCINVARNRFQESVQFNVFD